MLGRIVGIVMVFSLSGCAVLPDHFYPPFRDHHLIAQYIVPASGRIQIPATSKDLVVLLLQLDPRPNGESFDSDGTRWGHYERGTEVGLRGSFRAYSAKAGTALTPPELLPGARYIQVLDGAR
jgi:hypothetical protein